ncbi:MAG: hypothetical protein R3204_13500 [Oceanospirillum sp.]|nr:hypothetical protein [Oceanospirillum sp.]MDX1399535.1 hypothetical protein [Oceanospirillum sp.]
MSRPSRNPFLRLPICVGNDVVYHLIHADHILQITAEDTLSTTVELVNGKQYMVELNLKAMEHLLNQAYGHELARPPLDL